MHYSTKGGAVLLKLFAVITVILYQFGMSSGVASDAKPITNVGNPSDRAYTVKQIISKVPWDMIIEDNKLYIGGGDYSRNTGPVDVHCMDLSTNEWTVSGTLNDEAIGKFVRIGDCIYAPGFDAKGAKSTGNYYRLENGQWIENNNIPGAAHNFDIIEYDNKLLFAIGTWTGTNSPVQASDDGGHSFYGIPFFKDHVNIIEENNFDYMRVYDFFLTDNGLYCMFMSVTEKKAQLYEYYRYEDNAFYFVSSHSDLNLNIKVLKQEPISSEVTYDGQCYIAAYYLSRTNDFKTAERITLPRNEVAVDLMIQDDQMYVLCAEIKEESCNVRVYAYIYNSFFYPVLSFESKNLPISFAKKENNFYIGLGNQGLNNEAVGSIIAVTVPELTMRLVQECL